MHSNSSQPHQHRGFTLIELLVVVTIMGVVFGVAGASFTSLVERYKVRGEVDRFVTLISLARQTAITKGVPVTMCPKDQRKPDRCGKRNHWHLGSLVFEDLNENRRLDGKDAVIAGTEPLQHNKVQWRAFRNRSYLRFNPTGLTDWQNGHFLFCPVNGKAEHIRQLVMNFAGRTYLSEDADGDGIHENRNGKPLSC